MNFFVSSLLNRRADALFFNAQPYQILFKGSCNLLLAIVSRQDTHGAIGFHIINGDLHCLATLFLSSRSALPEPPAIRFNIFKHNRGI